MEDGYTATEALAALLILGLALSGLLSGLTVIGRVQTATASAVAQSNLLRTSSRALTGLLADRAPILSADAASFVGAATGFRTTCASGPCSVDLVEGRRLLIRRGAEEQSIDLPKNDGPYRFLYATSHEISATWPPGAMPPPAPTRRVLTSVLVVDQAAGDTPLLVSRLWNQQSADCEFDVVIQQCRGIGP